MKTLKNKKTKVLAIMLFATASIYAAAPVGGYLPGETTDPDCVPGVDINCDVNMAGKFIGGINSGDAIYTEGNVGIGTNAPENKLEVRYNKRYKIAEPFNRPTTPQVPLYASDLDLTKRDVTKMEPVENIGDKCFDSFNNTDGTITYYQEYEVIDISDDYRLSVGPLSTEINNTLKVTNKNDRYGGTLTLESLNTEPVYMNFNHEKDGIKEDSKRYLYIQAGNFGNYDAVKMGTNKTTPINMFTYNNGVSISGGPALPEAGLDISSLAHKFNVGTGNCPAGWTEGDYDGEADDADCLSPNGLLVRNGNVGIGVAAPSSKLAVSGLPSGTDDSVANGSLVGAVCITNTGNMYIDTDGSCAN